METGACDIKTDLGYHRTKDLDIGPSSSMGPYVPIASRAVQVAHLTMSILRCLAISYP